MLDQSEHAHSVNAQVNRLSLNGEWQFKTESDLEWRASQVPACWESQFPELQGWGGVAGYKRSFFVPESWKGKIVRLGFEAVDYWASVSVNGQPVGTHSGGYTPFVFEVQDFIRFGEENEIEVLVADASPTQDVAKPDGSGILRYVEMPHGKQTWYSTVGGIWGGVWIEKREAPFVGSVRITPDFDNHCARISVMIEHLPEELLGHALQLSIRSPKGAPPIEAQVTGFTSGKQIYDFTFDMPGFYPWSPDAPNLYTAVVTTLWAGSPSDTVSHRFGMRKISSHAGRVYLNNQPIYLLGVLDQDFYPTTIYTPPSTDYLRDQFLKARQMGLNLMRCHIKVPDQRYLDLCDELGLLVWYEIPNVALLTEQARKNVRETLEQMLARDYNHPCIVILTLFNESWGIDLNQSEQRQFLTQFYNDTKLAEPTRLIVDNSACIGNCHVVSDLADYHYYYQIPDHAQKAKQWLDEFVQRESWVYSSYGDAVRQGEPLVVSEWGNWGLPEITPLLEEAGGKEPWYFNAGWGNLRPAGVLNRFDNSPLKELFGHFDTMARWTQMKQLFDMRWQIEEMRLRPQIAGYVITEFQDIDWEVNGMIDFLRREKAPMEKYAAIQSEELLIARTDRHAFYPGETIQLSTWLSHWSNRAIHTPVLTVECPALKIRQETSVHSIGTEPDAYALKNFEIEAPDVQMPLDATFKVRLSARGKTIAETDFTVLLAPRVTSQQKATWRDPLNIAPNAEKALRKMGFELTEALEKDALLITTQIDEQAREFIRTGGTALLFAIDGRSVPKGSSFRLIDRNEDGRWGDWCSAFLWFRDQKPFNALPDPNRWDFRYEKVIPEWVLSDFQTPEGKRDTLSGLFVGWLNSESALAAQARFGEGKLLMLTFDCVSHLHTDPVSAHLLRSLSEYAIQCQPETSVEFSTMQTLIPTAEDEAVEWRYTLDTPSDDWMTVYFDDKRWFTGKAGFGLRRQPLMPTGTDWQTPDIWIRREFNFEGEPPTQLILRIQHDEDCEVYLNGKKILELPGFLGYYEDDLLDEQAISALRQGHNVLAIHCRRTSGDQYIDAGLFARKD